MNLKIFVPLFAVAFWTISGCDDSSGEAQPDGSPEDAALQKEDASVDSALVEDASEIPPPVDAAIEIDAALSPDSTVTIDASLEEDSAIQPDASQGCSENQYGTDCEPCSCQHGVCNSGIGGNGQCLSCESGWFGDDCEKAITCQHGTADIGADGTGKCTECETGYFGENCIQNEPTCVHGAARLGISGDGHCSSCEDLWTGEDCNRCISGRYGQCC